MSFRKIINDPVYGFITIDDPLIFRLISHPWYQRLRRIKQMALAYLVYPGAVHTRLHHSLGAYHLMGLALTELRQKGTEITAEEERAARIAILLHDIGHGPFSHALEHVLVENMHHEEISLLMMHMLNKQFEGKLDMAISIFKNTYPKKFLHQLVSGQLDVDRMDYLTRDSFFTGVSEGVIGYDRIIKMLCVHDGELMVEEKGIYSIEKFLVARRLMYWQVYLHKTVVAAEMMLVKILERARQLAIEQHNELTGDEPLIHLLSGNFSGDMEKFIELFTSLDDTDLSAAMKKWSRGKDPVLSYLCSAVLNRRLLKIRFQSTPIADALLEEKKSAAARLAGISADDAGYLAFTGESENRLYDPNNEHIYICYKDGTVKNITEVDHPLIDGNMTRPVKKFYICYVGEG